ncbi:MAG: DUF2905 domain-containing protein [Methylococcaceae bacterium]
MELGRLLVTGGIVAIVIGLTISYVPWLLNWFGKLPFDIRIQNENSSIFIPITSMLVISIMLSIIINLFFR